MSITVIKDDITRVNYKYIVHQCNCVTNKSAHLSKTIFTKFPYADIYKDRIVPDNPGTIKVMGNGRDQRYVINLFGQYYPGKPKYPNSNIDGYKARSEYFHKALHKILEIPNIESIAFPYGIGCGAAGGDWNSYMFMIEKFSNSIQLNNVEVYICKFV